MDAIRTFAKDPDAVLDFYLDWTPWLDSDEEMIVASRWRIERPNDTLRIAARSTFTHFETKVVLAGGTPGQTYIVTNHVTTLLGREEERSLGIAVQQR